MNVANGKRTWEQRIAVIGVGLAVLLFSGFMMAPESSLLLKISKSIDVFGRVYKEVATSYVDEIDPEKFMEAGIDGMLETLDPYTVYIDKDNGDEVDLMTNGKYGGIGVTIGTRDGAVRVISVMDGYSAQRQGIVPGDRFIEIGGSKVTGLKPDEIRNLTRGEPGSEVKVLVEREGEPKPLEFVLIREEIQVRMSRTAAWWVMASGTSASSGSPAVRVRTPPVDQRIASEQRGARTGAGLLGRRQSRRTASQVEYVGLQHLCRAEACRQHARPPSRS